MKFKFLFKTLTIFVIAIFISSSLKAQVPQGINYQAVVRNATGQIVQNQSVSVKFSIHQATPTGTIVYEETHGTAQTNSYGLVNLQIGQGTPTLGTFSSVQWGKSNYFLQVQANIGSGFINLGTSPFLTVPYAMVADSVVSIAKTGVIPNTYGNSSSFPTFTVNAQGQLTSVGTQPLPANLPPNGNAGGDLGGTYPNPSVTRIQGANVSNTAPTTGQFLGWNGTSWTPTNASSIYILNSSNYLAASPMMDKVINVQGTITLTANYGGLSNDGLFITGGTFDGNNSFKIYFGTNSVISGVKFNNIQIDGNQNMQFINCTFSNITLLPLGCNLTGCQINSSTLTAVNSIGSIISSNIGSSSLPRLDKINNSTISSSTIGSSTNCTYLSSNNQYNNSTVYIAGLFTSNNCDDTRLLGFCIGRSLIISSNNFSANSMSSNIIEIDVTSSSRYSTTISNNNFLGNSASPVGEHIKIKGYYTGTRYLTKISNNVTIGGSPATSRFITIDTYGQIYHMVNDNSYLYTGSLGVSNSTYIIERNNTQY